MDDTISRLAVIQIIEKMRARIGHNLERSVGRAMIEILDEVGEDVEKLPSAQPEIIRCRECKFASGDSRICMKFDHSPIGELDFCSFAERREVNNESD